MRRTISGMSGHIVWDDVTGGELKLAGVKEARTEELRFFKKRHAYTRCPRSAVEERKGKLIGVRWMYTNKGDLGRS